MSEPKPNADERTAHYQAMLTEALANNHGRRDWREWKSAGAQEVIDLIEQTPRMELFKIDLTSDLHLCYGIRMPVPRPPVDGRLIIADAAVFDLRYEETWRWESPPGWAPLGLWQPQDVFHPNCRPALRGAICLGTLPPGIRVKEIVLLGYYTLTLQDRALDETDPHGVLNPWACEFYRTHPEYLPLTHAGLLDPWEGVA